MKRIDRFLPDVLCLSGLSSLGYGLYLFKPWVSFTTVGVLLIIAGISLGRKATQE